MTELTDAELVEVDLTLGVRCTVEEEGERCPDRASHMLTATCGHPDFGCPAHAPYLAGFVGWTGICMEGPDHLTRAVRLVPV